MKTEKQVRAEYARLMKLSRDESLSSLQRTVAYDSASALQWVFEDVAWTPSLDIKKGVTMVGEEHPTP